MEQPGYGVNTIEAHGISMLLTVSGGGQAIHLTRLVDPGALGRSAIEAVYLDDEHLSGIATHANYDREALLAPSWSDKTVCGRDWAMMIGGEGGTLSQWDETAFAPTCRKCLASLDKLFPSPADDKRLPLVAQVVADIIVEHGFAEVHDVPGDQLAALRKQIRARVRAETGHAIETHHIHDVLYLSCGPIYQTYALEYQREAVQAVRDQLPGDGDSSPMTPSATVSWTTWASEG